MERFARQNSKNPNATYYPKGELVIVKDSLNNFELAWKFAVSTLEPDDELLVIISAITGKLINKGTIILDNNAPCVAQTLFSSNQNITGDTYTGGIRLSELRKNVSIHTLNMRNQLNNYINAAEFSNNSTNWTSGSWANINQDQAALDAHWAGEMVFDYWHNVQNRNSIDGSGIPVTGYVHFFVPHSPAGWPNNAAWVPGNNGHFMEYGDGDGTTFKSFVALDIAAHEFGHGVKEFTSNLGTVNHNQEEDALNEGLSDIWGISVKNFAAPNKPLWLLGGEILLTSTFNCIRNAQDPKSTLAIEGQHPDTYHGQFWSSTGEPHCNSTVLSHWFYLLAQGISGGIGINKAEQIVYQAEAHYLQPGDGYADARNAMITAATDLYCANSPEVKAVTNAWYAVGVGNLYSGGILTINVSDPICTSATSTLQNQPSGITSLIWSTGNSNNLSINSSGLATRVGSYNGDATIYAAIQGSNGCSTSVSANIHIGLPDPATGISINQDAIDPMSLCANTEYAAFVNPAVYTDYKWTLPNDWPWNDNPIYTQDDMIQFVTGDDNTGGDLIVQKINSCGMSAPYYIQLGVSSYNCQNFSQFTISPNPATNSIIISSQSQQQNKKLKTIQSGNTGEVAYIKEVRIYNSAGKLQKQQAFSEKASQVKMDISNLSNGVYFIEISDGQQHKTSQKLVISK